jgi:hypothetical protein
MHGYLGMSRVGAIGGVSVPVRAARSGRADPRFGTALDAANGPGDTREAAAACGVSAAASLLSLQEIPDATTRNRKARQAAEAALAALREMQAALLGGGLDRAQLGALADVAARAAEADDPGLREAAQSVALRAAVELARLDQARLERRPS